MRELKNVGMVSCGLNDTFYVAHMFLPSASRAATCSHSTDILYLSPYNMLNSIFLLAHVRHGAWHLFVCFWPPSSFKSNIQSSDCHIFKGWFLCTRREMFQRSLTVFKLMASWFTRRLNLLPWHQYRSTTLKLASINKRAAASTGDSHGRGDSGDTAVRELTTQWVKTNIFCVATITAPPENHWLNTSGPATHSDYQLLCSTLQTILLHWIIKWW